MMVLRGQLEAALILLYLIDAEDDKEFHERATTYRDWVHAKMKETVSPCCEQFEIEPRDSR